MKKSIFCLLFALSLVSKAQVAGVVSLVPDTKATYFNGSGQPLAGGSVQTFQAGTTTPLASFTDSTGTVANPNPVILDSAGRANIWLSSGIGYKIVVKDSLGVTQWTTDNVFSPGGTVVNASQYLLNGVPLSSSGLDDDSSLVHLPNPVNQAQQVYGNGNWYNAFDNVLIYGAKGDFQWVTDAVSTSGSGTVTSASALFAVGDVGKSVVVDNSCGPRPVPLKVCSATNGSIGTCTAVCLGGAIDTTTNAREVFITETVTNTCGEGTHRTYETWIKIPAGNANNCVKVSPPTFSGWSPSPTQYNVYAVLGQPLVSPVVTTGEAPGTKSGQEVLITDANCGGGHPAIAAPCELDSVTAAGGPVSPPGESWTRTTITQFNSPTSIGLAAALPHTNTALSLGWGTNNATAFTSALAQTNGRKIMVPRGGYYVACPGISIPQANVFLALEGESDGSKILGPTETLNAPGASYLVSGDTCPIITFATSGNQPFGGGKITDLGFWDFSKGLVPGGVLLNGAAHWKLQYDTFQDIRNGYGIECNSGGTQNQCQFNHFNDLNFRAVKFPFIFTGGKTSDNVIISAMAAGSQMGGDIFARYDSNSGSSGGGAERLTDIQALYYTRIVQGNDRNTFSLIDVRGENSNTGHVSGCSSQCGIMGGSDANGSGFGTGLLFDGTPATAFCTGGSVVGGSMNFFGLGELLTANCTRFSLIPAPDTSTDSVENLVFSQSTRAWTGKDGIFITDTSSPVVQQSQLGAGTAQSQVTNLFVTGNGFTQAAINTNGGADGVGLAIGTVNAGIVGTKTGELDIGPGNWTATGAATVGDFVMTGGNSTTTAAGSSAGNVIIKGGSASASTSAGPNNGNLALSQYFVQESGVPGAVICPSVTNDNAVRNCPLSAVDPMGINISTNGGVSTEVQSYGLSKVAVAFDALGPYSPARGWYACTSATTVGTLLPQAAACPEGRQVGKIMKSGANITSSVIWIQMK